MTKFILTIVAAAWLAAGTARGQEAWVQIEALPTLADAQARAQAWSAAFSDVTGFRLSSGWYGIVLGPYLPEFASNRLVALRAERLIPADSFIADGSNFRERFWPVGAIGAGLAAPRIQSDQVIEVIPAPETSLGSQPDESPAEARRSEALLSVEERMALQTALQWFGLYDSGIDGAFGRGTRGSMAAWQAENGFEETGVLTAQQRAALLDAYRAELDALGLGRLVEQRAGIEIEMPVGLVEFDEYAPPFVRYREKDGSGVRVLLISQEGTGATLDGLYEVMQTLEIVPLDGFRERQGESFTLTGQGPEIRSHTYARLEDGMIKGFTLIYPPEAEERMARAVEIMRGTLRSIGPALDPTLGAEAAAHSRDLLSGLEIRRPERTRSGVYVDPEGAVLTVAEAVEGCDRVTLDDLYDVQVAAVDRATGLALLRPQARLAPARVAALAPADPRIGAAAAVAGFPFGPALTAATLTFGTVEDLSGLSGEAGLIRLQAETEPGEAGGPVFDPAGRVAGVLLPAAGDESRQLPPGVRFAAKAGVVSAFLAGQGITVATGSETAAMAPEDITEAAMGMTVLVACWN